MFGNIANLLGVNLPNQKAKPVIYKGGTQIQTKPYSDDYKYVESFDGKHIIITGATGTVGSKILELLLKCNFKSLSIFCRNDDDLLPLAK